CQDEIENPIPDYTLSDVPTTIAVKLDIPGLTPVSRADLSEQQLNQVNSVWIRTYSSTTGEATSDWVQIKADHKDTHITHPDTPVTLESRSGYSYIVAVANVENLGVTMGDDGNVSEERPISELLKNADTWDQFRAISVASPVTNEEIYKGVTATQTTLVMSGIYTTSPDETPENWETLSYEPVFIPAPKEGSTSAIRMEGKIHLRRLVSHITFNLKPGNDVTITPQSFTVANVPRYTWLYERTRTNNESYLNTGDHCNEGNKGDYYATPDQFSNQNIRQGATAGTYTFDFWQGENKHEALPEENCDTYNDREREDKVAVEGATEGSANSLENTGLYTSLTGKTWTPNNMASYVIVRCSVRYKEPVTEGGQEIYREGTGVYIIHLGYCEGKDDAAKSKDFNCRRNVNYTYNVTIKGINDIYVEARRDGEPAPGAEGIVSALEYEPFELDCHYGAFNVTLTEEEVRSIQFMVQTFYNGQEKIIDNSNMNSLADGDMKFINWIEFRPTTGEHILAEYKPREGTYADGKTFNLLDAASSKLTSLQISPDNWYTVFVNEYVYEDLPNESGGNWCNYVNQDARRFYLRVTENTSLDGQSIYAKAKYAVSQRSIQSYYSTQQDKLTPADTQNGIPAATAIGAEHVNEMLGMNLQRSFNSTGFDDANGRYNVWLWLNGVTGTGADTYNNKANKSWNTVLKTTTQQYIPAVNNKQGYSADAKYVNLLAAADFTGTKSTSNTLDPQTSALVEAINSCMNRNRDLNGDGEIQPNELRWYVPAVGKYLRMILGRNSLQNPIMDYDNTPNIINNGNNGNATRYLMYASNNKVLWTMEGLATSEWTQGIPQYCSGTPWEVRCIRNLGSNLSTVTKGEKVSAAYSADKTNRIVRMSYYDMNSVRTEKFTDEIPVHTIADQKYNRCYYAFQYATTRNNNEVSGSSLNNGDNPCSYLNTGGETGWRVPNQKELAIMLNLGVLDFPSIYQYYISCTIAFYNSQGEGYTSGEWGDRKYMGVRYDAGTQVSSGYIRCVRDVDP
ncbi:MAG: DUF1566 domain-containing protein, partial [Paramuribaculum sp.]|nr:DUF1566 domain-containing protein [Paramuribaculum sp.]